MRTILASLASGLLATLATAQLSVVIPNGCAAAAGNTSNAFPWGSNASTWGGLRLMCIYDSSNFTLQGVTTPILINRLRWRPDNTAAAVTGGTFTVADVRLSTAPMDYTGLTTNFAGNHGPDLTTAYSGPVVHSATLGSAGWTVNSWCVDIALTVPFLYDPSVGDLVIDCDYPGGANFVGGTVGQMDVQGTGSLSGRIWASANYPAANGSALDHGVVVEVGYAPPSGYASAVPIGAGCVDRAGATFYQTFPASTFDLSNSSIAMMPTANGYVVLPGGNQWFTPVGANLGLTDDSVSAALPLGFTLNYPGGSTTAVTASSNGFVWAQTNTANGCCTGDPILLRTGGARWCALWNDLNPGGGGTVTWDQDPVNGAAYLTFTNVPEYGNNFNLNTFQYAFFASGIVELRWQTCAITAHVALTGWSPGANNSDPGSIDLSTALPIVTEPDTTALAHSVSARPVLGTAINLLTTNVSANTVFGAMLLGLNELNPPLDLTLIGMPTCSQYLSVDATSIWFPVGGTAATPFALPSSNVFAGVQIKSQSAALVPGINAVGAVTSNAMRLTLDVN